MDLNKLRAFVVVAEELNFRKSAEILGMSQPPLSRLIASLEDELATPLFERTTRQVKLTNPGVLLLREAREILDRVERLQNEVRAVSKARVGTLRIGFSTTAFLARLPLILEEFQGRFPQLHLDLHQSSRSGILRQLREGRLDVGFVEGTVADHELQSLVAKDEVLGVLVARRHRLAKRKQIRVLDLEKETVILHPRRENQEFFDSVQQLFRQSGIRPQTYTKSPQESCAFLVSLGKGVSLTIAGSGNFTPEQTRFVPLEKIALPVTAVWKAQSAHPLLKTFLSFVSEKAALGKAPVDYRCLF